MLREGRCCAKPACCEKAACCAKPACCEKAACCAKPACCEKAGLLCQARLLREGRLLCQARLLREGLLRLREGLHLREVLQGALQVAQSREGCLREGLLCKARLLREVLPSRPAAKACCASPLAARRLAVPSPLAARRLGLREDLWLQKTCEKCHKLYRRPVVELLEDLFGECKKCGELAKPAAEARLRLRWRARLRPRPRPRPRPRLRKPLRCPQAPKADPSASI